MTRAISWILPVVLSLGTWVHAQTPAKPPQRPTFDCRKATGEIEAMICKDAELIALDRRLADVYARALKRLPATVAADVLWISLLRLLTERGASPFFLLHVFVISSVSVRWGFMTTVRVCALLAVLYPVAAYAASHFVGGGLFECQRYHIFRAVYLLVLGYLIGYLGEHELQAKRKLGLMLELMTTVRRT